MTQLFGANVWPVDTGGTTEHEDEIRLVAEGGGTVVRVSAVWSFLEPTKGLVNTTRLAALDAQVNRAFALGMTCMLTVAASPPWAAANWYEVPNIAAYGAFCGYLAKRYGPARLCGIEIWNEPNAGSNPLTGYEISPAKSYTEMTQAAYAAVHPTGVPVIMGAISYADTAWLGELYAAGIKGSYDSISVHPYADGLEPGIGNALTAFHTFKGGIEKLHARMVAQGDTAPMWITEFGWKVEEVVGGVPLTQEQRAAYIKAAYEIMKTYGYIAGGTVYELRSKGDHFGMVDEAFTAYPALAAFGEVLGGGGGGGGGEEPPPPPPEVTLPRKPVPLYLGVGLFEGWRNDGEAIFREFDKEGKLVGLAFRFVYTADVAIGGTIFFAIYNSLPLTTYTTTFINKKGEVITLEGQDWPGRLNSYAPNTAGSPLSDDEDSAGNVYVNYAPVLQSRQSVEGWSAMLARGGPIGQPIKAGDHVDIYIQIAPEAYAAAGSDFSFFAQAMVFTGVGYDGVADHVGPGALEPANPITTAPNTPGGVETGRGAGTVGGSGSMLTVLAADWTAGPVTPPAAPWVTIFNAASHGNNMLLSYMLGDELGWQGGALPESAFTTSGGGAGHFQTGPDTRIVGQGHTESPPAPSAITITPDSLLGEGGLRKEASVSGSCVADAHSAIGLGVPSGAALYLYYAWHTLDYDLTWQVLPELLRGGQSTDTAVNESVARVLQRLANGGDGVHLIDTSPTLMELAIDFKTRDRSKHRWKLADGTTGEDAILEEWWLTEDVAKPEEPLTGDVYVGGALVGGGVPLAAGDSSTGVKFVLPRITINLDIDAFLPIPALALHPTGNARWNALALDYTVSMKLWYPPAVSYPGEEEPEEEGVGVGPGGPPTLGAVERAGVVGW